MSTFPATASLPQSGSVVSRWLLDEASGNAIDEKGSKDLTNNGVGAGAGFSDLGVNFDNARDFELSESDYFVRAHDAALNGVNGLTFAVWIKLESIPGFMRIGGKWNDVAAIRRPWNFEVSGSGGELNARISDSSGNRKSIFTSAGAVSAGTWFHVAFVYESSTRITIYVDGGQIAENTTSMPAFISSLLVNT